MKIFFKLFFVLLFFCLISQSFAQAFEIKAEVLHGKAYVPPTIKFAENGQFNLQKIELKGLWQSTTSPTPTEAWAWFQNVADDCPQASLDWTGVTIDTTWKDNGDGTFSISQDLKNKYSNGNWTDLMMPAGWLAPDAVYSVELLSVSGGVATNLQTLTFDANSTTNMDFTAGERKIKYVGKKDANVLLSGQAESLLKFEGSSKTFTVSSNIEFLRVNWLNNSGQFYTIDFPVTIIAASELGLNIAVEIQNNPVSGFYNSGDTIDVNVTFTNDGGTELLWNEGNTNGIEKFEFYLSGPKQNYATIYKGIKVIDKFALKNDATGVQFTNPIRLALPANLPGTGTYTFLVKAKRIFGSTVEKYLLSDIQVGKTELTSLPVSNCSSCHAGPYVLTRHSAVGEAECLVCHVDDMGEAFSKIAHSIHMVSPHFSAPLASCNTCHVDNSQNQFTAYADQVCTACHNPVPYFPTDHSASVPLYSETGMSCATLNCHAGGGMGVFKNISETHAAIADKYVGGTLTAKGSLSAPVIDGVVDDVWNDAQMISTYKGVELKAIYDDNNIYFLAQWKDGHNLYTGSAAPSHSIKNKWWSNQNGEWSQSGNEDRFAFLFDAGDANGASCAKMCHSTKEHKTATGNADVWHWKAARTNPIGVTDDKWWSTSGRGSDSKTISAYSDNKSSEGNYPLYSGPITDNYFIIIPEGSSVDSLETNVVNTNEYPGYILNANADGSRFADVMSKGVFDSTSGKWTLEFKRAFDTGNSDDVVFTNNSEVNFTTATFDNTGGGHASQGIDVGVYTLILGDPLTAVEESSDNLPFSYSLKQNYPNPFNPNTTINFDVKSAGHVTLEIFNSLGQRVRILADKEFSAGSYKVDFDGSNLSSGIYYYRINITETGSSKISFENVRKMVLMK